MGVGPPAAPGTWVETPNPCILRSQVSPVHTKTKLPLWGTAVVNCLLLSWSCKVWHSVKLVDGRGSQNYLNLIGPRYNTDFIIKVASLLLVFSPPLIIYSLQLQKADAASPATARILVSHSVPPLEQAMPVNSCCTSSASTESKTRLSSSVKQLRRQPQRQCAPWPELRRSKWLQQGKKEQKGNSIMNRSNSGAPQGVKQEQVRSND